MQTYGFLERLKELFTGSDDLREETPWSGERARPPPGAQDHAIQVREFTRRLEEQDATSIVAGCVELLGLERVREALGPRWPELADRALIIAQETLDLHLGPEDVYRVVDGASFQICFQSGDEALARRQIARISAAIEARIDAELAGAEELSVASFVAPVPCERIRDASDPLSALYSSLLEIRDAVNARAIKRHSIPALRYAGALFQPLWSNRDFGWTKNRCLLDTLAGAAAAKHVEEIEELDDLVEALANLDCVVFAKSIEGLHHALGDIKQATILVPVHFPTLALEQPEFLEIAATLPMPYRRFVLLDLIGVPTATTRHELLKALRTGRAITDRIVVQISPTDRRIDPAVRSMIWGVSMSLGELDHEDPLVVRELSRFALAASEVGLCSFAYGANTIGKATTVVAAGFDYVGGTAVASTGQVPRSHGRFTPLFGDIAERPSGLDRKAGLREHPRFAPVNPNSTVTLPDGQRDQCRIPNVSASGAVVLCRLRVKVEDYLVVGSIPSQVVRKVKRGFAVRFLEVQQPSAIELALQTPLTGDKLLQSLRILQAQAPDQQVENE